MALIDFLAHIKDPNAHHKKFPTAFLKAPPGEGTWERGDVIWNTEPIAGGPPGWVCVAAGTPGTWKAMANLAA